MAEKTAADIAAEKLIAEYNRDKDRKPQGEALRIIDALGQTGSSVAAEALSRIVDESGKKSITQFTAFPDERAAAEHGQRRDAAVTRLVRSVRLARSSN